MNNIKSVNICIVEERFDQLKYYIKQADNYLRKGR